MIELRPDFDCPRGVIYEFDHPEFGWGSYCHPADLDRVEPKWREWLATRSQPRGSG